MDNASIRQRVISLRRKIHQYPELGRQEFKTTDLVCKTLKSAGIPFKRFKPTGVVALLKGRRPGPCVALRADMDALPLEERTPSPFRSRHPGVMHACGHDGHTAMVLTAALVLAEEKDALCGSVKFLFQPDEEGAGGAKILISGGALKNPDVDAVFGVHVNPRLPAGTLGVKPGPLMASVDRFTLDILGEGGHGAYPHEGRDAVVIAAQVVNALQTLASRRIDPVEPVVVTIGTIEGGRRFNVLAESVRMTGTVRTLSHDLQRRMPGLIKEIVGGVVKAHGGRYKLDYQVLGHPLVNDGRMTELAARAAEQVVGAKKTLRLDRASMGGEDFSEYLDRVPGSFVYVGTGADRRTKRPWHHPSFFLHEGSLEVGVKFLCAVARESLVRLCS